MSRRIEIENLQAECRKLLEKSNMSHDENCVFQDRITLTASIQVLEKIKKDIETFNERNEEK